MRIRAKYFYMQLIVVGGFIASITFLLLRFNQTAQLKALSLNGVTALSELEVYINKTSFINRSMDSDKLLWEDWTLTGKKFDFEFRQMLASPAIYLLSPSIRNRTATLLENWDNITEENVKPLNTLFERLINNETMEQSQLDLAVVRLRDALVTNVQMPTSSLLDKIELEVKAFSSLLYILTASIAVVFLLISSLFGLNFARTFGRNIALLEKGLASVAGGNFSSRIDIKSKDEFGTISSHFNSLIGDLWFRLDAMKNMMQQIEQFAQEPNKKTSLEHFILQLAVNNTHSNAGMLMTVQDNMLIYNTSTGFFPPPMPLPGAVSGKKEYVSKWFEAHKVAAGEGILGEILSDHKPRFIRDNRDKSLPDNADAGSEFYINSAVFIPIHTSGELYGVLSLARTTDRRHFTDLDYSYMQTYCEFVGQIIDNRIKYLELERMQTINREIEVAADIQKTLLPGKMPKLTGAEAAAFSHAAKGVSGDYYDVFHLEHNKTAFVICDVAGKGVPASLMMIMIRTILRTINTEGKQANELLQELNRTISARLGADRFATISLLIFDTVQRKISYSNGAHHPLYIYRKKTGTYRMFDTDGLPMGIDINASFGHKNISIEDDDYLILFTDGLPESKNIDGKELGTERLLRFIARNAGEKPKDLCELVNKYLDTFTEGAPQHDDQTFLVIKAGRKG